MRIDRIARSALYLLIISFLLSLTMGRYFYLVIMAPICGPFAVLMKYCPAMVQWIVTVCIFAISSYSFSRISSRALRYVIMAVWACIGYAVCLWEVLHTYRT